MRPLNLSHATELNGVPTRRGQVPLETKMMMTTQRPERRARFVALLGLAVQLFLAMLFTVLAVWSQSQAVLAVAYLSGVGIWIWLLLVLIYHQRVMVQDETFETEQLERERVSASGTDAIFDVADEELLLARRRLRWMYRWVLPIGAVLITLSLLSAALSGWSWGIVASLSSRQWAPIGNTGLLIWFVVGGGMLSFLFSRYATGMARQPEWRMLHAGGAFLMGVTLSSVAVAVVMAVLHFAGTPTAEHVLARVFRLLMIVLAIETALNFVLDFYRPRGPDEAPRPAFDSRLLGLFTEPGGIARSIAEAINYQFGFEVSSTWFYKLLQRSVVPLIGFGLLTLIAATCLVFVDAEETAFVERYGARNRQFDSGLHLKWPWPIEVAYKVGTRNIHELRIGDILDTDRGKRDQLLLWTNKHSSEPHLKVLVAAPQLVRYFKKVETFDESESQGATPGPATRPAEADGVRPGGEAVPVGLLRVAVTIQYRVRDAYQWLRTYSDPLAVLEAIAEREIMRYSAEVEVKDLLAGDRAAIEAKLSEAIRQAVAKRDLGVDIVFVGLQGVHPPAETAQAFQDVVGAESKRTASVRAARAEANKDSVASLEKLSQAREEQVKRYKQQIEELTAQRADVSERLTEARVAIGQLMEKRAAAAETINALRRSIREAEEGAESAQHEIAACQSRITESEQAIESCGERLVELRQRAEEIETRGAELRHDRDAHRQRLEELAVETKHRRSDLEKAEQRLHEHQMALQEAGIRRDELVARVREELKLELAELYEAYEHAEQDWTEVEEEIAALKQKISRLGNINLDAIAEQEELEERDAFLTTQRDDLENSRRQLDTLIAQLNEESRKRFIEAFDAIRENFRELFRKLFGGGKADIILENPEDVLESGIEILARPPGKELQSITLMSGGEKSMTAIALLMSIFRSRPSPFAILDEVDAALDEANNERFNGIIREFLDRSQFIIITHSKRTMGIGDQLYGVTMQEPGVSTRVSVKFEKTEQNADTAVA